MEFPTVEEFEENKVLHYNILKWLEVPTEVIYRIESVEKISTKIGSAMGYCKKYPYTPRGGQLDFQNIFSDATLISIPNYLTSLRFYSIYFGN